MARGTRVRSTLRQLLASNVEDTQINALSENDLRSMMASGSPVAVKEAKFEIQKRRSGSRLPSDRNSRCCYVTDTFTVKTRRG